jgi:hypothetical protein
MSDRKIIDGWPALEPRVGFADRVMARLDAVSPSPALAPALSIVRLPPGDDRAAVAGRASLRSTLVFCAVAVAALVLVPLALHRHVGPAQAAASAGPVAVGVMPDLGLERD